MTKVPGSYSSYYVDQQINSYLSMARAYLAAGFSQEEAVKAIESETHSQVKTLAGNSGNVEAPGYLYYFRYLPYLFLGVFCYVMGYILMAFRQGDIQRRMEASAVSMKRQSLEGLLAMGVMGITLWGIGIAGAGIMYGKKFCQSGNLGYYLANSLLMMAVALSLSYLVGMFMKNSNMLSGVANVISLGMCFLCGVFVPMSVMDQKVLKVSRFLPVYWYEQVNELLGEYTVLPDHVVSKIYMAMGIEALFAVAFVCLDPGSRKIVTVHSVHSNTLRDAGKMNLLAQSPRSIVCSANLIYANRISRGMSRIFCELCSQKTPRGILPVNSNGKYRRQK